jgi:ketosteroid isomerase-like protein
LSDWDYDGAIMTNVEAKNISIVRAYLAANQGGKAGEALRHFFTDDALQVEMPNQLNNHGQRSDLENSLRRSQQGLTLLQSQQFEIVSEIARDDRVAVEARWTGVLAVDVGAIASGTEMKASFAMFFEFSDGQIAVIPGEGVSRCDAHESWLER